MVQVCYKAFRPIFNNPVLFIRLVYFFQYIVDALIIRSGITVHYVTVQITLLLTF